MTDIDLHRVAATFLAEYGADTAWQKAAARAADIAGDAKKLAWWGVILAIDELKRTERAADEALQ